MKLRKIFTSSCQKFEILLEEGMGKIIVSRNQKNIEGFTIWTDPTISWDGSQNQNNIKADTFRKAFVKAIQLTLCLEYTVNPDVVNLPIEDVSCQ